MSTDPVSLVRQRPATSLQFIYQPLEDASKEIRLVEITRQTNERLELRLSKHSMVDAPNFSAISYTWGDGTTTRMAEVIINGQAMDVTDNCRYALKQACSRYHHEPSGNAAYFWIDAICIDQNSDIEKQHQVAMMGRIFAQATRVLACVGPHQDDSDVLAKVLQKAKRYADRFSPRVFKDWYTEEEEAVLVKIFIKIQCIENLRMMQRLTESFSRFSERYYWTRLWIVQEVASAKDLEIICGTDVFSRSDIHVLHWIAGCCRQAIQTALYSTPPPPQESIRQFPFLTFVPSRTLEQLVPALDIMSSERHFGCSRPEDRVYGMLPLIEWPKVDPPIQVEPVYGPAATFDLAELFLSLPGCTRKKMTEVFQGLEIWHGLDKLEHLVSARFTSPTALQSDSVKFSPKDYVLGINICGFISRNGTKLTSSLLCSKKSTPQSLAISEKIALPILSENTSCQSSTVRNMVPNATQPLYLESEIAALLCDEAREGDLVAKTHFGLSLLILRPIEKSDEYDIVGQGFLMEGFDLDDAKRASEQDRKRHRAVMHNHFGFFPWLLWGEPEKYVHDLDLCYTHLDELYEEERQRPMNEARVRSVMERFKLDEITPESQLRAVPLGKFTPEVSWRTVPPSEGTLKNKLVRGRGTDFDTVPKGWRLVRAEEITHDDASQLSLKIIQRVRDVVQKSQMYEKDIHWSSAESFGEFILRLEPLDMLLLACQDLELNGSRNPEKMMFRPNTFITGKAWIETPIEPSKYSMPAKFPEVKWLQTLESYDGLPTRMWQFQPENANDVAFYDGNNPFI